MSGKYKVRSKEHLINLIKHHSKGTPNFALLIGAGASITSGVKPTKMMIEEWRRQEYVNSRVTEAYDEWIRKQKWHATPDEYAFLFERTFDEPSQRRIYIEDCVKGAEPFWGYIYLADLIAHNYFNVIFTPNFDDLLNEACFVYADCKPLVCAHDSAVSGIRVTSKRPKIIKLHGDFLYDNIKNTMKETDTLEKNMRDKFVAFATEYGLIVIGYGGNDRSIMDTLEMLLRSGGYFPHGLYWCLKEGAEISGTLDRFLSREKVYVVEIEDFDSFMAEIHNGLGLKLPAGLSFPYELITSRLNRFILKEHRLTSSIIRRDISSIVTQIKKYETALCSSLPPNMSPVPYAFLAFRELESGDFNQGVEYLEKANVQTGMDDPFILHSLAKGYRMVNRKNNEVVKELKKVAKTFMERIYLFDLTFDQDPEESLKFLETIKKADQNNVIYHNKKSETFYLMKKYEDALEESEIGLKIRQDPGLQCNRLSALKALGRIQEAEAYGKEILDSLAEDAKHDSILDYFRAYVYCILKDKAKMLACLKNVLKEHRFLLGYEVLYSQDFSDYEADADFRALIKDAYERKKM